MSSFDALVDWLGPELATLETALTLIGFQNIDETAGKAGNGAWRTLCNLAALEQELARLLPDGSMAASSLPAAFSLIRKIDALPEREDILPKNWQMPPRRSKTADGKLGYPMHGSIDDRPLAAAIWRIEAEIDDPTVRLLAATLITANVVRPCGDDKKDLRRMAAASRALRELLHPEFAAKLALLPRQSSSLKEYHGAVEFLEEKQPPIYNIELYLAWVTEARGIGHDNRGTKISGGGGGGSGVANPPRAPTRTQVLRDESAEILSFYPLPAQAADERPAFTGDASGEIPSPIELVNPSLPAGCKASDVAQSQIKKRAQLQLLAIERGNQKLAGRVASLTNNEAITLVTEVKQQVADRSALPSALIAVASLLLGRSLEQMVAFNASDEYPAPDSRIRNGQLVRIGTAYQWVVKPGEPDIKARAVDSRLSRVETAAWLSLPCPQWLGQPLFDHIKAGRFRDREKALDDARAFLSAFDKGHNGLNRYQPTRLQNWLPTAISNGGLNSVVSAIITADAQSATHAPLHYQQWSAKDIIQIYCEVLRLLDVELTANVDEAKNAAQTSNESAATSQLYPSHTLFGSVYTPEREKVRDAVTDLKYRLETWRKDCSNLSSLIDFHNDYAIYTNILVGVGLGLRGVHNAFPALETISAPPRAVVIRDKDSADGYHARLVPVAERVFQQLEYWRAHTYEIVNRFGHLTAAGVNEVREGLAPGQIPQPFLIDAQGRVQGRQVSDVTKAGFRRALPYPPNIGRHIAATHFAKILPPEELSAFMGHWIRGTEPFSPHSALDPHVFITRVQAEAEALLETLGLEPIAGLDQ